MGALTKPKHEKFAHLVANGQTLANAYVEVYGKAKGADQSACRLLKNANLRSRIAELKLEIGSKLLRNGIRDRENRLDALQNRHDLLQRVIEERANLYGRTSAGGEMLLEGEKPGRGFMTAPGAGTGLLCLDWRGKDACQAVWKVDTGLLSELRAIEEMIARELGDLDQAGGPERVVVNVTFLAG